MLLTWALNKPCLLYMNALVGVIFVSCRAELFASDLLLLLFRVLYLFYMLSKVWYIVKGIAILFQPFANMFKCTQPVLNLRYGL